MNEPRPQFLLVGRGDQARRIAYLQQPGAAPGIVWLQGFKSDMISTKASALSRWAADNGRAYVRFDYSGHGQSDGRFEDGTLSAWLEDTVAVFSQLTAGPQIVVGSSMGGNIALLLLRHLLANDPEHAGRIKALVLIAPAWNMTEELMWKRFSNEAKAAIANDGVWYRPSKYDDGPYPITQRLIEDGRNNLLDTHPWNIGRPVHIIHGRLDPDVPFAHGQRLARLLKDSPVTFTEVADGEHRLSRDQDLEVLFKAIADFSYIPAMHWISAMTDCSMRSRGGDQRITCIGMLVMRPQS